MNKIFKMLFLSNLLFLQYSVFSQEINNDLIGSTGHYKETSPISLSWSIGESIVETMIQDSVTLINGFQQGYISITSLINEKDQDFKIQIYPNPVEYLLNIKSENELLEYTLINSNGQTLKMGKIGKELTNIDFSEYPCGIYILIINNKEAYKLIKY